MKKRLAIVVALSSMAAGAASAQSGSCGAGPTQDACQMTVDLYQFLAPQLAASIVGGNATLGQGGTLGGLGHFTIEARGNAVDAKIPDVSKFPTPSPLGEQQYVLPTKTDPLPMATADASIGLFKGVPVGVTDIGGLDGIVSASYIPKVTTDNVSVDPKTNLKFGWGGRLGLLSESIITPGLSLTYLQRDLPVTNITGTTNATTLAITNATINTTAVHIVASKSFLVFGLALGYGKDKYKQSVDLQATSNGLTSNQVALAQSISRNNVFADLSLNAVIFKIVVEAGDVSGGTVTTHNTFDGGKADASRAYGSLGIRFGW